MEKTDYKHYFLVTWATRTRYSDRRYCREFETLEEAVEKARQVHDKKDPISEFICIDELEHWETPDPAPNGTSHGRLLRRNIDWWTGFLPWWELN